MMLRVLAAALLCLAASGQPARADTTLVEWRFGQAMDAASWRANGDVADVAVTADGLKFRGAGGDPILECEKLLDVPATPWQAVEVRLKADRDGECTLFWTNTTDPPYGGFRGEQYTSFAVSGDGVMHTYRVFPFWQKLGKLVRLRFDPYDGARFTLESIRVVEAPPPARIATLPDTPSLQVVNGLTDTAQEGARALRLTSADGFALEPVSDTDAEATNIVCLRAATRARRLSILFATDASWGLHSVSVPTVPDGQPHVYNVDMLNSPDWRGQIVAIGLRPGEAVGDACVVRSLRIADRPAGPPELRVQWFGVDDALPRAGQRVTVSASVTNAGGETARGVRATFRLPPGARVLSPPASAPRDVAFGEEARWQATVVFAKPGDAALSLRLASRGAQGVTASATAHVTPRPAVARAGQAPPLKPVRGPIDVGIYYFPGWKSPGQWSPITRFPERRPVLGWYHEGDPAVADWQIRWAAEHGVTFFAYDWYWSQGSRSLEHALHDGYLKSRYRSLLKFCLLWANHNGEHTSSVADSRAVARYWIEHYFRLPTYYRIGGRPVVIIFSTYRYRADLGSDGVKQAFDAMREECRKAGVPPVYLIACVGGDTGEPKTAAREGYDAITAYNWPGLGVKGGERWAPFKDLVPAYKRQWESLLETSPLPMMTPVSGGWDNRPWAGDSALVRFGRTPGLFRKHLEDARALVRRNPGKTVPAVLIEAWNEFGEGSYVEPHREYGFGYLDAVRDVFTSASHAHTDLAPADVGQVVPQVDVDMPREPRWTFRRGLSGWETGMDITTPAVQGGALTVRTTGRDPAFFGPPIQVQASAYPTVHIRLCLLPVDGPPFDDEAQLFWATRTTSTSEAQSVRFTVIADGRWHDYTVPVASNARWRGVVASLRLDPCNRPDVIVKLGAVELRR